MRGARRRRPITPASSTEPGPAADAPAGGLAALLRRAPVAVAPDAPVREAIARMVAARVGTVVICESGRRRPLGILTQRDALARVVLGDGSPDEPVAGLMTGGVVALGLDASAHQARLVLARHDLRHLVVVDADGGFAGVLSRSDLYSQRASGGEDLIEEIQAARSADALVCAARRIGVRAAGRVAAGDGAERVGEWVAMANDLVVQAALDLAQPPEGLPLVRWCWLGFGSEGRLEQTLATDQDNGLVFEADDGADVEALRARFVRFAGDVNRLLDDCGFPLCEGGIMAGNPRWCLSLAEWRAQFADWMISATPEALLHATIFFDFRALAGDWGLADALRGWLLAVSGQNALFLRFMAGNALQGTPPLGVIRDFVVDRQTGLLDLKRDGARIFVDAARILALALGVADTSTAERLRAAARLLDWPPGDAAACVAAFHEIQRLRLKFQVRGASAPNRIEPDALDELERAILKESLRQARRLQERLRARYQL